MKKNMGTIDRVIRTLLAIVVLILYLTDVISGVVAIILVIIAVIFLLTSLVSFCPLYSLLKFSTMKKEETFCTKFKFMRHFLPKEHERRKLEKLMKNPNVIDARRILNPKKFESINFRAIGLGN